MGKQHQQKIILQNSDIEKLLWLFLLILRKKTLDRIIRHLHFGVIIMILFRNFICE